GAPDRDSPPVLWSLLDGRGAAARWAGVEAARWSDDPAPAVAHGALRHLGRRVRCRDALLAVGAGVALVRLVRSDDGPVELCHQLTVGGFEDTPGAWDDDGDGFARAHLGDGVSVAVDGGRSASDGAIL